MKRSIVILAIAFVALVAIATDYNVDFKPSTSPSVAYHQIYGSTNGATWTPIRRITNAPLVTLTNAYLATSYQGWSLTLSNLPTYAAFAVTAVSTNGGETAKEIEEPLFRPSGLRITEQ